MVSINPDPLVTSKEQFDLSSITDTEGKVHPVHLEVIEWAKETKRALYLCNAEGFPLSQIETRFHVGPFYFSAYLKSTYVADLHNSERLGMAELEPQFQAVDRTRRRPPVPLHHSATAARRFLAGGKTDAQ